MSTVKRELIVVDNASTDATATVLNDVSSAALPTKVLYEPRLGKSYALNRALEAAGGEFLLFTDDDATVESGWADELVAPFEDRDVGAVGGRIHAEWLEQPPRWLTPELSGLIGLRDYGDCSRELERTQPPLGVNMAIRADVLRGLIGRFDPSLGHRGRRYLGHEEIHVMGRIFEAYKVIYQPRAEVVHRVLPERLTYRAVRRAFFRAGFGLARAERLLGLPQPGVPKRVVRAWRTCVGAWKSARQTNGSDDPNPEAATRECQDLMWAGKHLEMLVGRVPRLSDWLADHLV